MSQRSRTPASPLFVTVPGIAMQGCGVFLLPFVVGLVAAVLFEVTEVTQTLPALVGFTILVLLPVSLAQILGLLLKSRRDIGYWRERGELGPRRLLHVLHDHLRVVTLRGWMLLAAGLLFTVLALALKWASFGLLATIGLFLFYLLTGWTIFVSTFLVRTFGRETGGRQRGIERQLVPAVVQQGEPADEVFTFRSIRIPWGYVLLVEDPLPPRLKTESRYAVGSSGSRRMVEARGRLRATPRGHFHLGPARLWYQDLLGITRVSVAAAATADLKVLPRFRPVEVVDPPRTPQETPDVLTKPHRYATEDHFRFREYSAGDDTRRIHWRLSLKSGRLQVRQPETREIATQDVVLLLDCYLPKGKALHAAHGADEILDWLVDAWIGVARTLIEAGDRVTLVAALPDHQGRRIAVERMPCRPGQSPRWQDMGARARWQGDYDLPAILAELGDQAHGVVVTARFTAPPPGPLPGQSLTWLFLDPADALGRPDPHWLVQVTGGGSVLGFLRWALQLPYPAGSEENAMPRRARALWNRWQLWQARRTLRSIARSRAGRVLTELEGRGDAIYRLEPRGHYLRLVGLRAQRRSSRRRAS